jgi:DNA polymerase III epsilon subunit-like protein
MNDVMIDLETLDTRPTSAILSIGAVRFDRNTPGAIGKKLHVHVDIDSCMNFNRTISSSTVLWWFTQGDEARRRIADSDKVMLPDALLQLSEFVNERDVVWGNGASFDLSILHDAFSACRMSLPWRFWNERCYRTLKALNGHVPKLEQSTVAHDALDDAISQALHLQNIMASVKQAA